MLARVLKVFSAEVLFPLSSEPLITSSFGEFRLNHPHGGIDLRAAEGMPVVAPNDGYVWRIKTTCYGNGKSLYIKGDEGRIYAFLHLAGFAPKIFEKLFAEQLKTLRYTQDIFLEPTEIRVKRGEVVAYAGKTGTNVPHLHYEVRDKNNCPTNPLFLHAIVDREPPTIKKVALVPIGTNSLVERTAQPTAKTPSAGVVEFSASGRVGIVAEIVDKIPPSYYELAPYRAVLKRGEDILFSVEMNGFCYENRAIAFLVYKPGLFKAGKFLRLYLPENIQAPFVSLWTKQNGIINITGTEELLLQACDLSSNCSEVRIRITPDIEPKKSCDESMSLTMSSDFIAFCSNGEINWINCGNGGILKRGDREVAYGCPSPGEAIRLGSWSIEVDEQSLFAKQILAIERFDQEFKFKSLVKLSDFVKVMPDELLSIKGVKLCITSEQPFSERAGIYRVASEEKLWLEGAEFYEDRKKICARVKRSGVFVVLEDGINPKVGQARILKGGYPEGWFVEIPLSDVGSGIDCDKISVKFDSTPLVVEYMPYEGKARAYLHMLPTSGPTIGIHEVSIRVLDVTGNSAQSVQQIVFSPQRN